MSCYVSFDRWKCNELTDRSDGIGRCDAGRPDNPHKCQGRPRLRTPLTIERLHARTSHSPTPSCRLSNTDRRARHPNPNPRCRSQIPSCLSSSAATPSPPLCIRCNRHRGRPAEKVRPCSQGMDRSAFGDFCDVCGERRSEAEGDTNGSDVTVALRCWCTG